MGAFLLDSKPMPRTLIPVIVVGLLLLYLRPSLWMLALSGLIGYTLVHGVILRTAFTLTPVWADAWNVRGLWGPKFWAIPVDEIVWSAVFGAIWPIFTAYLFNARLLLPDQAGRLVSA